MAIVSERVARRLAAIYAADVAEYSRLMGKDEVGTLRALTAHREIMDQRIVDHGGRIANTAGDSDKDGLQAFKRQALTILSENAKLTSTGDRRCNV